jgi:hypothetical protein
MGLLCGCIATVGVCELQRRDGQGFVTDAHAPVRGDAAGAGRTGARRPVAAAGDDRRPGAVGIGRSLPFGLC